MRHFRLSAFWTGLVLAAAGWVFVTAGWVLPGEVLRARSRRELQRAARELELAKAGTPGRADVASWTRYKEDLTASSKSVAAFYSEGDRRFERWFPGLETGSTGVPARDAFVARLRDEAKALEEALGRDPHRVKIGPEDDDRAAGFNWEPLKIEQLDAVGPADLTSVLHEAQKRFWARRRVADIVLRGGVRVHRLVDFRFFKRLHEKIRDEAPLAGGSETVVWQGLKDSPQGRLPRDFEEAALPRDLGRTFTFGVVLELPCSEVARAVREVLNPEGMLIRLVGSQVTIRQQNPVSLKVEYDGGDEDWKRKEREFQKGLRPRDVLLELTCEILDFDLDGR